MEAENKNPNFTKEVIIENDKFSITKKTKDGYNYYYILEVFDGYKITGQITGAAIESLNKFNIDVEGQMIEKLLASYLSYARDRYEYYSKSNKPNSKTMSSLYQESMKQLIMK